MQRRGRSRHRGVLVAVVVVAVAGAAAGCVSPSTDPAMGPDAPGPAEPGPPTYDAAAMSEGVELEVPGDGQVVTRAVAFHPAEVPEFEVPAEHDAALGRDEAVVLRPGLRDHDVTVVYRTGPYCGLLPALEVRPSEPPTVVVAPGNESVAAADRDCESMEFTEAVGLELAPDVDPDELPIEVVGR
jgi:hypothetical protein